MTQNSSRREFLKVASAISATGVAAPIAINLAALGTASAATAADYKALVCIYLTGGNDYANTVTPFDNANHAAYLKLRPSSGFGLTKDKLVKLNHASDGFEYGLRAAQMQSLADIFNNEKRLAVLANIGSLIEPTTKTAFKNKSVLLPRKLFSHNDQESFWQSLDAEGAAVGWGGRMGDILMSLNKNVTFTCISPAGSNVFLSGNKVFQYQVTPNGPIAIRGTKRGNRPLVDSLECADLLKSFITESQPDIMGSEFTKIVKRSIDNQVAYSSATLDAQGLPFANIPSNPLGDQLRQVLQSIYSSSNLGTKRQIFFVSLAGFDLHNGMGSKHAALLKTLGDAMSGFYKETVALGIQNQVTTFTASDFGRSWGNDDGSDHGWGSFHFVLGGAVNGGKIYGKPPVVASDGPDDVGQGRLIPTTSVYQLAATLGKWLGLSDSQLLDVLPNLKNFNTKDLGFMRA